MHGFILLPYLRGTSKLAAKFGVFDFPGFGPLLDQSRQQPDKTGHQAA
jgi:hypothetical protein